MGNVSGNKTAAMLQAEASEGHQAADADSATREKSKRRQKASSSSQRYLVRQGVGHIFQLRVPDTVLGDGKPRMLRVSLGPMSAWEARRKAELLVVKARGAFEAIERKRASMSEGEDEKLTVMVDPNTELSGHSPDELMTELRGYLKGVTRFASQPAPATPPHQVAALDGLKGLVNLAREIEKGDAGNPLIVENAEILKARYLAKLSEGTALATAPADSDRPSAARLPVEPVLVPHATSPSEPIVADTGKRKDQRSAKANPVAPPAQKGAFGGVVPSKLRQRTEEEKKADPVYADVDRRTVERPPSTKPLFSDNAIRYLEYYEASAGKNSKDVSTARARLNLFIELIGDHPIDTYTPQDFQAYLNLLKYWPAKHPKKWRNKTAHEVIAANSDLAAAPLAMKAVKDGYFSIVKRALRHNIIQNAIADPFAGVRFAYPDTARPSRPREPLGADQISSIFRVGVESGFMDDAMLPLLGHLTSRRLGLLVHLRGSDIREKYKGIWVAQTSGIVEVNGTFVRTPRKTDESMTFFVLHDFLKQIGFIDFAMGLGDQFLFPQLMRLKDPSRSASHYMGRLFDRAGVTAKDREVFHSFRGGNIDDMRRNKVDSRDRRLQAGHALEDEHDRYGVYAIDEEQAAEIAFGPLKKNVDYSMFWNLNFRKLHRARRTRGRKPEVGGNRN